MKQNNPDFHHLFLTAGAFLAGAWWVKNQTDDAKKSRAERNDPDGVKDVCTVIGPLLDDWEPEECADEDEFVEDLFEYLAQEAPDDWDIEMCPSTAEGKPDILIHDRLALEVKVNPNKSERDRLVGQTAGYSRE